MHLLCLCRKFEMVSTVRAVLEVQCVLCSTRWVDCHQRNFVNGTFNVRLWFTVSQLYFLTTTLRPFFAAQDLTLLFQPVWIISNQGNNTKI